MNRGFTKTVFEVQNFFLCYANNCMLLLYLIYDWIIKIYCVINFWVDH